jgi:hypothetical protein
VLEKKVKSRRRMWLCQFTAKGTKPENDTKKEEHQNIDYE